MNSNELHKMHRSRLRKKFNTYGLEILSDHEILELLLYFGIPVKNTNEMAHRLLHTFGTVSGALEASYEILKKQEGMGEVSATLFKLVHELIKRYSVEKNVSNTVYDSREKVADYLMNHYTGATSEHVQLLAFDSKMRMVYHTTILQGSFSDTDIPLERIAEPLFTTGASRYILAHNHPSGRAEPSKNDLLVTRHIYRTLSQLGKTMIDHIIISGPEWQPILKKALGAEYVVDKKRNLL